MKFRKITQASLYVLFSVSIAYLFYENQQLRDELDYLSQNQEETDLSSLESRVDDLESLVSILEDGIDTQGEYIYDFKKLNDESYQLCWDRIEAVSNALDFNVRNLSDRISRLERRY